jgi:hypothetical protein
VGIIAWRYGWIPKKRIKSITEMEYDAAKEGLMFLLNPELPVNPEKDFDPEPDRWDKQKRLAAFKKRFSQRQMPALFESVSGVGSMAQKEGTDTAHYSFRTRGSTWSAGG